MSTRGILSGIKITGLSMAVPDCKIDNESLFDKWGEEYVRKVMDVTGIRSRYVALPRQCCSDFAYVALEHLRQKGIWATDNVDALIFVTQSPDYHSPSSSCVLHHRLHIHPECLAYDINHGCSGFIYALFTAGALLQMPNFHRVLICGGDCSSLHANPENQATAALFGDGCFGGVVEKSDLSDKIHFNLKSFGDSYRAIMTPGWAPFGRRRHLISKETEVVIGDCIMEGMDVFTFTVSEVPAAIKEILREVPQESIDYLFLHQANLFIMKQIARSLKFKMDRVPVALDRYGNTAGASIPLTLCDFFGDSGELKPSHLLLAGFGVGLSLGIMDIHLVPAVCEPVIHTRHYYDDGTDQECEIQ